MPGRDGRQVFATLREQGYNQPIILISANPLVGPPDYAEQSSWMFLQKAFLPNELVARRRQTAARVHLPITASASRVLKKHPAPTRCAASCV
jgi:DNA-binding response OmpR family regulator